MLIITQLLHDIQVVEEAKSVFTSLFLVQPIFLCSFVYYWVKNHDSTTCEDLILVPFSYFVIQNHPFIFYIILIRIKQVLVKS